MAINAYPASGLFTTPNVFDDSPMGSLSVADNVQFTSNSVLEPRRGYELFTGTFGSSGDRANSVGFYRYTDVANNLASAELVFVQYGDKHVAYKGADAGGNFNDLSGDFYPVDVRMRFVQAARDVFFNTTTGNFMVSYDGVVTIEAVPAGCPVGLSVFPVGSNTSTLFPANKAAAYCFTICQLDAYRRIIEGPPSPSMTFNNQNVSNIGRMTRAGTTVTVTLTQWTNLLVGQVVTLTPGEANFPVGAKTITGVNANAFQFTYTEVGAAVSNTVQQTFNIARNTTVPCYFGAEGNERYFIRLYRTEFVDSGIQPAPEYFQAFETPFMDGTDISNGYIVIEDTTPEIFLDTALYTNENTGEGALQANYEPPQCLDMNYWSNRVWFANAKQKESLNIQILGVGSPNGVQINDTITIDDLTYTFVANRAAPFEVTLISAGDAPRNVRDTAINLVNAINLDSHLGFFEAVYAQYVSTATGVPGKIFLFDSAFGVAGNLGSSFRVTVSRAESWTPVLSTDTDHPTPSDPNYHQARLWYSKLGIPEAAPLVNFLQIDADNQPILRIFPLNYRLYVFKTDGMYYVSGNDATDFSVRKFSEARLVSPDSVGVLNERLYCFTTQGFGTVIDSTFTPMSQAVDDNLNDLFGAKLATAKTQGVGVGYESARQYLCYLPNPGDVGDSANLGWVYSILSGGFTNWDGTVQAAVIRLSDDKLWVAPGDRNQLLKERKTFTSADFQDIPGSIVVSSSTAIDGNTSSLNFTGTLVVGDSIFLSAGTFFLVTAVDGGVATYLGPPSFGAATYAVGTSFRCEVLYNKASGGTPASLKEFQQVSLLWRENEALDTSCEMESEVSPAIETVELVHSAYGFAPWGEFPWGAPTEQIRRIQPLPVNMANSAQLSVGFEIQQAQAGFQHLGIVLEANFDTDANRG